MRQLGGGGGAAEGGGVFDPGNIIHIMFLLIGLSYNRKAFLGVPLTLDSDHGGVYDG